MILPKEDKYYGTKETMREQIIHLLGGRVAEMLTLDDISTGASNDIQRATDIAKEMVTKYGFSDKLGPVNYSSSDEVFLGKDFSTRQALFRRNCQRRSTRKLKRSLKKHTIRRRTILSEHHRSADGCSGRTAWRLKRWITSQFEEIVRRCQNAGGDRGRNSRNELKKTRDQQSCKRQLQTAEKMHKKAGWKKQKKRQLEEAAKALEEKHGDSQSSSQPS